MEFLEKLLNLGDEVKNAAPLSERVMLGLQTALIGMGVIFLALIILWAVLSVFKLVFYKPASSTEKEEAPAPEVVPVSEPTQTVAVTDDTELVAVITAAIASMTGKPTTSFRVVSFRHTASK